MLVDAVILGVLLVSAVFAFLRGFIREVLTILGVVGGLAAALLFGEQLIPLFNGWLGVEKDAENVQLLFGVIPYSVLATVLAYGSIFLVVVIVLSVVSHFLAKGARTLGLGAVDRTLGVAFGIARGVVVLAVLYLLPYLLSTADSRKEWAWTKDSRMIVYIEATSAWLAELLPDSVREATPRDSEKENPMVKATREKLKELDLIKSDDAEGEKASPETQGEGHVPSAREDMQELILEQTGDTPAEGTPPPLPERPRPTKPAMNVNE